METPPKLEDLLNRGVFHVVFEPNATIENPIVDTKHRRIILQGIQNRDGSINEDLAGRLLSAIIYLHDDSFPNITLVKRITYNSKGEPSGELLLNSKTGKVVGGYGWVDWKKYNIVPLGHAEDAPTRWRGDTKNNLLYVRNSFTAESAEKVIAEAQIKYDSRRAA